MEAVASSFSRHGWPASSRAPAPPVLSTRSTSQSGKAIVERHSQPQSAAFPSTRSTAWPPASSNVDGRFLLGAKGAPEAIVQRAGTWRSADSLRPLQDKDREQVLEAARREATSGGRVLAVASRELSSDQFERDAAERDLILEGLVVLSDPLRPEHPAQPAPPRTARATRTPPPRVTRASGSPPSRAGCCPPAGAAAYADGACTEERRR